MPLSRQDTAFLKGIAILMIVLHNFCHWLPRSIAENEYTFKAERIWQYVDYVCHGGPHLLLNFFSHYGHYGVPLFLFLSGYGLVRKYEAKDAPKVDALKFIGQHAVKLWWLMLPAVAAFYVIESQMGTWKHAPADVVTLVCFVGNLLPVRDLLLGPWWYFSLILQLYIIYALLLHRHRSTVVLAVVTVACVAVQALAFGMDWRVDWGMPNLDVFNYMRYNFPGSMLAFAIGIWAARNDVSLPMRYAAAGGVLLLASAFNAWLWLLSPIFLLMALVPLAQCVNKGPVRAALVLVGKISAALFAVHPIVRAYTIGMGKAGQTYTALAIYLAISLIVAWLFTLLLGARHNLAPRKRQPQHPNKEA